MLLLRNVVFSIAVLSFIVVFFLLPVSAGNIVKIDGSSTVYPITEAMAEEFQKAKRGKINVTVGISGTGGGFKKFCRGEIDIANASRPILKKEIDVCKENNQEYIEIPIAYDGIVVMVNPKNNWVTSMTVTELKKIWEPAAQGIIKKWNDIRSIWPNAPLNLYGAGVDSGTFDYFTEAIVGKSKSSRGDFTSSEDDNILVQGIALDKNALGFFGYAYYYENKNRLKLVAINNGRETVLPSEKTIMNGTYQPLSRPIFIYVNKKSATKSEIKEFVEFYLKKAQLFVKQVGYVSLPEKAYKLAEEKFAKRKTGTMFGGDAKIGVKIEDLLRLEEKK